MTIVPYQDLAEPTLAALIEEFVTRQGAVQGHQEFSIEQQVADVLRQLKSGMAMIVFDPATESCTIVAK